MLQQKITQNGNLLRLPSSRTFVSCGTVSILEFRIFFPDPFDKLLHFWMTPQPLRGMVMVQQLPFREYRVDFAVAYHMQGDRLLTLEGFGNHMVLIDGMSCYQVTSANGTFAQNLRFGGLLTHAIQKFSLNYSTQ